MAEVVWSPSSLEDIDRLAEYIARDSPNRAALFVTRLIEAAEKIPAHPHSGRVIPEIGNPACREILYRDYRIMYRIEEGQIWITGIVHGARDWKPC